MRNEIENRGTTTSLLARCRFSPKPPREWGRLLVEWNLASEQTRSRDVATNLSRSNGSAIPCRYVSRKSNVQIAGKEQHLHCKKRCQVAASERKYTGRGSEQHSFENEPAISTSHWLTRVAVLVP